MSRFLLGFVIGAAVGAAVVILTQPRSGGEADRGVGERLRGAIEAGRQAAAEHENSLMANFRQRMEASQQPSPRRGPDFGNRNFG